MFCAVCSALFGAKSSARFVGPHALLHKVFVDVSDDGADISRHLHFISLPAVIYQMLTPVMAVTFVEASVCFRRFDYFDDEVLCGREDRLV